MYQKQGQINSTCLRKPTSPKDGKIYIKDLFEDDRGLEPNIDKHDGHNIGNRSYTRNRIPKEELMALQQFGADKLASLCQKINQTGKIPTDMMKSIFINNSQETKMQWIVRTFVPSV